MSRAKKHSGDAASFQITLGFLVVFLEQSVHWMYQSDSFIRMLLINTGY